MFEAGACSGGGKYALYDLRSNDLARSAPGGEAVENDERTLLAKRRVPVSLVREVVYAFLVFRHGEESVRDDRLMEFIESGRWS
jgi:hypothetical protein